jgi:hypothetical protein
VYQNVRSLLNSPILWNTNCTTLLQGERSGYTRGSVGHYSKQVQARGRDWNTHLAYIAFQKVSIGPSGCGMYDPTRQGELCSVGTSLYYLVCYESLHHTGFHA